MSLFTKKGELFTGSDTFSRSRLGWGLAEGVEQPLQLVVGAVQDSAEGFEAGQPAAVQVVPEGKGESLDQGRARAVGLAEVIQEGGEQERRAAGGADFQEGLDGREAGPFQLA